MKKILGVSVVLMYMLSGIAVGYAQDTTDNATTTSAEPAVTAETTSVTTDQAETQETTNETEPEAVVTSEPVAQATDDSGITATVDSETATTVELQDEVKTEEDLAEVTPAEEVNDTEKEVESMQTPEGVELRVTQLQERIDRAIAHGQEIIAQAAANNASTTGLQASLDKLVDLKAQAAAIPVTGDVSEITAQFVAVKKAAIEAVKEFRTEARKLIKEDKRAALKARMKAKEEKVLAKARERISKVKAKFNAKITEAILERLGDGGADIAAKIESGEITPKEARQLVVDTFKQLSSEKKAEARQKLSERKAEIKVKRTAAIEKAKERKVERVENVRGRLKTKDSNETESSNGGVNNE